MFGQTERVRARARHRQRLHENIENGAAKNKSGTTSARSVDDQPRAERVSLCVYVYIASDSLQGDGGGAGGEGNGMTSVSRVRNSSTSMDLTFDLAPSPLVVIREIYIYLSLAALHSYLRCLLHRALSKTPRRTARDFLSPRRNSNVLLCATCHNIKENKSASLRLLLPLYERERARMGEREKEEKQRRRKLTYRQTCRVFLWAS